VTEHIYGVSPLQEAYKAWSMSKSVDGDFRSEWLCEPSNVERNRKLHDLAIKYHAETEAYDRIICTGKIRNGGVMPETGQQSRLIKRNAISVRERIVYEAVTLGFTRSEIQDEIHYMSANGTDRNQTSST
jgi:hypothetical protein